MKYLGTFLFSILLLAGMAIMYCAYATNYEEGKQYQRLPNTIADNDLVKNFMRKSCDKVQVIEFFSYGCEWCYKLDPYIEKWRKNLPENVEFVRVPVEFHPTWAALTKAYYTETHLNVLDKMHSGFFEAIHKEEIKNSSEETLRKYFETYGISPQEFNKAFGGDDVKSKQAWANGIAAAYRITSVPVIVVQGSKGIFMTAVKYAGSEDEVINVANNLIKMQNEGNAHPQQMACSN